jgi:RHH-type rel operon transcriptional repressor/antitoxin RelB
MQTISFQIDEKLNQQLETFSKECDRSKGYILRKAIESFLEDQDDLKIAQTALEEFYISGAKTYSLEEIKQENDL